MNDRGLRQPSKSEGGPGGFGAITVFVAIFVVPWFVPFEFPQISEDPVIRWLFRDYSIKSLILVVIFAVPFMRRCAMSSLGSSRRPYEPIGMTWTRVGAAVLFCVMLSFVAHILVSLTLVPILPDTRTSSIPSIESVPVYWFDLTFGLALNAIAEEMAFRGVAKCMIERFTANRVLLVVISSILFGLIHWSHGLATVISTALFGVIMMVLYLRMGSIVPPIITHYLVGVGHFV